MDLLCNSTKNNYYFDGVSILALAYGSSHSFFDVSTLRPCTEWNLQMYVEHMCPILVF